MKKNDKIKIYLALSFCLIFHLALDAINIYRIDKIEKEQQYQEQIFFSKYYNLQNEEYEEYLEKK